MSALNHRNSTWADKDGQQHSDEECSGKRRKFNDEQQDNLSVCPHENSMKVAGFSLSAIEELKSRADDDQCNGSMDQKLREFQVLDEVGSNSDDDEGKIDRQNNFLKKF